MNKRNYRNFLLNEIVDRLSEAILNEAEGSGNAKASQKELLTQLKQTHESFGESVVAVNKVLVELMTNTPSREWGAALNDTRALLTDCQRDINTQLKQVYGFFKKLTEANSLINPKYIGIAGAAGPPRKKGGFYDILDVVDGRKLFVDGDDAIFKKITSMLMTISELVRKLAATLKDDPTTKATVVDIAGKINQWVPTISQQRSIIYNGQFDRLQKMRRDPETSYGIADIQGFGARTGDARIVDSDDMITPLAKGFIPVRQKKR